MSNVDMDVAACAERGAALLDRYSPYWYERVSIGALDMCNNRHCVLGQVYGNYVVGLDSLAKNGRADGVAVGSDHYGFSAFAATDISDSAVLSPDGREVWNELGRAWYDEITIRRMGAYTNMRPPFMDSEVAVSA